jgi:hypothetical protein
VAKGSCGGQRRWDPEHASKLSSPERRSRWGGALAAKEKSGTEAAGAGAGAGAARLAAPKREGVLLGAAPKAGTEGAAGIPKEGAAVPSGGTDAASPNAGVDVAPPVLPPNSGAAPVQPTVPRLCRLWGCTLVRGDFPPGSNTFYVHLKLVWGV